MIELGRTQKASGALPFSAVVGQEELKEALLAVAVDDGLDGLLVRGEKGTAKSTTVRALAELLPDQQAIADCPYGCPPGEPHRQCGECRRVDDPPVETRAVPLVTLPLGATRERVVGTLSVADALGGDHEFEPGLLARANRGILYVDEVNLLDDHLVDVLLDAAAAGVNRVERDGVSRTHPADFTLVGTMNPEEGELRPQLRDRFALQATVTGCETVEDRVTIIDRALGEDQSDSAEGDDCRARDRLLDARTRLPDVTLQEEDRAEIAQLCLAAGVEGHRGDIATARAARAIAALAGRDRVLERDICRAAELALPHRLRSRPFEDGPDPDELLEEHFEDAEGTGDEGTAGEDGEASEDSQPPEPGEDSTGEEGGERSDPEGGSAGEADDPDGSPGGGAEAGGDDGGPVGAADDGGTGDRSGSDQSGKGEDPGEEETGTPLVPGWGNTAVAELGDGKAPDLSSLDTGATTTAGPGSRARSDPAGDREGPRVRNRRTDAGGPVDAAESVRAAARRGGGTVETRDLRESVRAGQGGALVVFVVDASASMRPAMRVAKGTLLGLLEDAYQHRDEVAFVAFAGDDAEVLLPPTDSVTLAARHLKELPTGDRTPLPAGLRAACEVLDSADPDAAIVALVTDGRTNASERPVDGTRSAARALATRDPHVLVVDAGDGARASLTDLVVEETGGQRVALSELSPERIDAAAGAANES
jgi:magnesium chelatase subunit D